MRTRRPGLSADRVAQIFTQPLRIVFAKPEMSKFFSPPSRPRKKKPLPMTDRLLDEPRLLVNRSTASGGHTLTLQYMNPFLKNTPPRG